MSQIQQKPIIKLQTIILTYYKNNIIAFYITQQNLHMNEFYHGNYSIHQKKEQFRKAIHSKILQEIFSTERRRFFIQQQQTQGNQTILNSVEELKQLLDNSYIPPFGVVSEFIKKTKNQPLPEPIIDAILSQSKKPLFMETESALILLINLFNKKDFNTERWLNSDLTYFYVNKVFSQNKMIIQNDDQNQRNYKLNHFNTICRFLQKLVTKNKESMFQLKQFLPMMEAQAYHQLPADFIFLLSQLSTCKDLLPSQKFIQNLLSKVQLQTKPLEYSIKFVRLLTNYLTQQTCESPQQYQNLAIDYFTFIVRNISNYDVDSKIKIDLINLVTNFVSCLEENLLVKLLSRQVSKQLYLKLYSNARSVQGELKQVSFLCFSEILSSGVLLYKQVKQISPVQIILLLVDFMTKPDRRIQKLALQTIMFLLVDQYRFFIFSLLISDFENNLKYLESSDEEDSFLTQLGLCIYYLFIYQHKSVKKFV